MTCDHCEQLISAFVDGDLEQVDLLEVQAHLSECEKCSAIQNDLKNILQLCDTEKIDEIAPPNEQALWCRISNLIEAETKTHEAEELKASDLKLGFWEKVWNHSWSFSFRQIAAAVLGIALISSLLTMIELRRSPTSADAFSASLSAEPTLVEKALSKIGLIETPEQIRNRQLSERRAAIEYWNKRVEARRAQWDANLREAFDRNLNEIDYVVNEYTQILDANPHDQLSGELLDSALNEKMELLREFAEL